MSNSAYLYGRSALGPLSLDGTVAGVRTGNLQVGGADPSIANNAVQIWDGSNVARTPDPKVNLITITNISGNPLYIGYDDTTNTSFSFLLQDDQTLVLDAVESSLSKWYANGTTTGVADLVISQIG